MCKPRKSCRCACCALTHSCIGRTPRRAGMLYASLELKWSMPSDRLCGAGQP